MKNPHPHAEIIKAWADGAEIQCRTSSRQQWFDQPIMPIWDPDMEYRIKPTGLESGGIENRDFVSTKVANAAINQALTIGKEDEVPREFRLIALHAAVKGSFGNHKSTVEAAEAYLQFLMGGLKK